MEIPTTNLKKSGGFYKELFGWEIDYGWGSDYAMFNTGEGVLTGGGLDRKDEINPGNIIIYVQVEDINAMLKKAMELGGKKVKNKYFVGFSPDGTSEDCKIMIAGESGETWQIHILDRFGEATYDVQ